MEAVFRISQTIFKQESYPVFFYVAFLHRTNKWTDKLIKKIKIKIQKIKKVK